MRNPLPALLALSLLLPAPGARADFFGAPVELYAPAADEAARTEDGVPAARLSDIAVEQEAAPAFGFRWNTQTHEWEPTHERTWSALTLRNGGEAAAALTLSYAVATAEADGADAEGLLRVLGLSGTPDEAPRETLFVTVPRTARRPCTCATRRGRPHRAATPACGWT